MSVSGGIAEKLDRVTECLFAPPPSVRVPWPLRIVLACLGGTCVFLAFPRFDMFFLAYIALAIELWAAEGLQKGRQAFLIGWLAGSVTNIGGFYWIGSLLEDFGHMSPWLSMTLCAGLGILQGLVYALWIWGVRKLGTRSIWTSACALFVAVEMFFPMIFPWYYANSQYNFIPMIQTADIFGVLGVTFLLVVVNVLIFDVSKTIVLRLQGHKVEFNKKGIAFGCIYIAAALIYGGIRIAQIDALQAESPKLRVGMVEGDVGIWEKETPVKLRNNLFTHHTMSHELSEQGVDLLVWPESSYQSGLIWGSQIKSDYPLDHELDAMFAPWFQPQARLIYNVIDAGFGPEFHRNPVIRTSMFHALFDAAEARGLNTLEMYYPSLVSGYSFPCRPGKKQIMKCPYTRVVPDDLTFYLPSAEPLRASRRDDLIRQIRPEDISSPVRDFDAAVLFGTLSIDYDGSLQGKDFAKIYKEGASKRKLYNTAHLVEKDGRVLGKYHKNYLLIFGEYIPYAEKFPWVYDILPEAGNLTPGEELETMHFRGYELGPIICYEDILPRFVQKLSKLRPHVFVNVTNDAWFGKTSEPMLHLALAMMRTVEHRRWLIRSTNTGVSAFVDANGRMVQHTSIYEPEILREEVPMMPRTRTVYSYIGDILGWISLIWVLFLMGLKIRMNRRAQIKTSSDGKK